MIVFTIQYCIRTRPKMSWQKRDFIGPKPDQLGAVKRVRPQAFALDTDRLFSFIHESPRRREKYGGIIQSAAMRVRFSPPVSLQ